MLPGWNTVRLLATDPITGGTGETDVSFRVDATPPTPVSVPVDVGLILPSGAFSSSQIDTVTLQLGVGNGALRTLSLIETGADTKTFASSDGKVTATLSVPDPLSTGSPDTISITLSSRDDSFVYEGFNLVERGNNTREFYDERNVTLFGQIRGRS